MASDFSPAITVDGIECGIYLGPNPDDSNAGIVEQATDNGIEVTIPFICAWADRFGLIRALKGNVDFTGLIDGIPQVTRTPPSLQPYSAIGVAGDDVSWNYVNFTASGPFQRIGTKTSGGISNDTPEAGWTYSDLVIIPAFFETTTYQIQDNLSDGDISGRWYTTTIFKPAGEIICPPTGAYYYGGNLNSPVQDQRIGIYRSRAELTITRHFMPYSASGQMQAIVNCVNSQAIEFINGTSFAPGTMLLKNIESRPYANPSNGFSVWDITYYFAVNTIGPDPMAAIPTWNQIMDSNGNYADIANKNKMPPFAPFDFEPTIWPEKPA